MSVRNNSNQLLNPQAMQAMDKFKQEAAEELNVGEEYKSGYWGNLTSRECGAVGGQMVKQMINEYENQLANGNAAPQPKQQTQEAAQEIGATNQNAGQGQQKKDYNLSAKAGSFQPQQ